MCIQIEPKPYRITAHSQRIVLTFRTILSVDLHALAELSAP
jgi:hypothetical protein